jgi:hypothetical protein
MLRPCCEKPYTGKAWNLGEPRAGHAAACCGHSQPAQDAAACLDQLPNPYMYQAPSPRTASTGPCLPCRWWLPPSWGSRT